MYPRRLLTPKDTLVSILSPSRESRTATIAHVPKVFVRPLVSLGVTRLLTREGESLNLVKNYAGGADLLDTMELRRFALGA